MITISDNGDTYILPQERYTPPDISNPTFEDLVDIALLRVLDAAVPLQIRPPRLFPTVETICGGYHTYDDWLLHGDLETELARISFMMSNFPERGIPAQSISIIRIILSSESVLGAWESFFPTMKVLAQEMTNSIVHRMKKQTKNSLGSQKSDFITIPVDYETRPAASIYGSKLWSNALSEIILDLSDKRFDRAAAFLQVFSFLRDPLGGLASVSQKAIRLFVHLISTAAASLGSVIEVKSNNVKWRAAAAQAAQEALFLASPLLQHIDYIHFNAHQQLPYVYVELDQLPRSEFSIPEHTVQIIEEIITSDSVGGTCAVAPICVSSYPTLPNIDGGMATVIIDGNHRATATMVLRLIAEHPSIIANNEMWHNILTTFCKDHGLGVKWQIDLADTLQALHGSKCARLIENKSDIIGKFQNVHRIPALVVREDNFYTACKQRPPLEDRPRLLLPIHQAIYNDESLQFAFPRAGQMHGRATGFKPMPLFPSCNVHMPIDNMVKMETKIGVVEAEEVVHGA
jgi:hypothetical protein